MFHKARQAGCSGPQQTPLEAMAAILHLSEQSEDGLVTVFQGYYDETESGDERSIAGLLGPFNVFSRFGEEWNNILNTPPRIQSWHTHSAYRGELPLRDFPGRFLPRDEAMKKAAAFALLIESFRNCLAGLHVFLSKKDHSEVVGAGKVVAQKFRNLFGDDEAKLLLDTDYILMRETVRHTVRISRGWNEVLRPRESFHAWMFFEENESKWEHQLGMQMHVHRLRRAAEEQFRRGIGPCIFLPSYGPIGWVTIQAGDYYAWHITQKQPDEFVQGVILRIGNVTYHKHEVSKERIEKIVAGAVAGDRPQIEE